MILGLFSTFLLAQEKSAETNARPRILFLGNSLTAGYGIDKDLAFPALIQTRIDSLEWPFEVINAGLSGETTAGGLRRIDWLLRAPVSVLVLELGANDGLRGTDLETTDANLRAIIGKVRKKNPNVKVVLAGMQVPPNLGEIYAAQFKSLYGEIAGELETELIPFLLEGVAGHPDLNLADGIHPTVRGHEIVAKNVWTSLGPVLQKLLE
ncbi:MAG TPA: arylesterase [Calditrichia bacterium]|nr:arylesterase [Calditrichia bacterium]